MKTLSLIQAIVLLHSRERVHGSTSDGRFVKSPRNMTDAQKLIHQVLSRNLRKMPPKTQTLFLLIERICEMQGIGMQAYRFTKKNIQAETGWTDRILSRHLTTLKKAGYLEKKGKNYRITQGSRAVIYVS